MNIDDCYYLGYISKTQGYKGGLIAFLDVDNPNDYQNLDSFLLDLNGTLTPFFVETITLKHKQFAALKLEDIDDRDAATLISNKDIYLPLDQLPKLGDDEYYLHELKGMMVFDKTEGEIGTVEKVMDHSSNPLIQIIIDQNEVLIPLIDDFIEKVDKQKREIHVDLPEGLIEVNQS